MTDDEKKIVLPIVEATLENIAQSIKGNIVTTGRNASGRTAKSVEVEMTENGGRIVGRQYFQGLEIGRPGGRVPYKFHLIIEEWMANKGIIVENPAKMARAIAWKIKREGTVLFKTPQYDVFTPPIKIGTNDLQKKVANIILKDLSK